MEFIPYNCTGAMPYTTGGQVTRMKNCNGFTAINTGDVPVKVNDTILYPGIPGTSNGDSKTWGGNLGEIYLGKIQIQFIPGGPGTQPEVCIDQKYYLIEENIIAWQVIPAKVA